MIAVPLAILKCLWLERQRDTTAAIGWMYGGDARPQPAGGTGVGVQVAHAHITRAAAHDHEGLRQRLGQAERLLGQPLGRWRGVRMNWDRHVARDADVKIV